MKIWNTTIGVPFSILSGGCILAFGLVSSSCADVRADEAKRAVTFSGGHETDPKDRGRPVVLIAAALEVKPEVFRKAFSGVTPARGGRPSGELARRNKDVLMTALMPHGVTNDRLDEVSNYYRYRPERDELWKVVPAEAYAVVEKGRITKIVVTEPGSGYSSPPRAVVEGFEDTRLDVSIQFHKDLKKNGSIETVELAADKPEAKESKKHGPRRETDDRRK